MAVFMMIKRSIVLTCMLVAASTNAEEHKTHWGYTGNAGPEHWAAMSPENKACSGKNQSPVNLANMASAKLPPIKFSYTQSSKDMLNNGHTVQVNFPQGNSMHVEGTAFSLKQLHFHAPSENQIKGKHYDMEVHLVHADSKGNLAVIAVMVEEGKSNPALEQAFAKLPMKAGGSLDIANLIQPDQVMPISRNYYRFNGSLTTPPCSEGVRWYVMKKPISASKQQIEAFKQSMQGANNRPVQPLNARVVLE